MGTRITNRGAGMLAVATFMLGVLSALALHTGAEMQSVPLPSAEVQECANSILADLDAAAEGSMWADVPAPKWEWLEGACAGDPYTAGVHGGIWVFDDGSYLIEGYGDSWHGCRYGWPCDS